MKRRLWAMAAACVLQAGLLGATEPRLAIELEATDARLQMTAYFDEAYQRYPRLPKGLLEALAYSQSRWTNLQPTAAEASHLHLPRAYGVMGLYRGEGFADQIDAGARLLKVSPIRVMREPRFNILAAAALLDSHSAHLGATPAATEFAPVLERYAGFAEVNQKSVVQSFARASFAYDVLLTLDRGVNDASASVPEQTIEWERAFAPTMLAKLGAPFVRLDVTRDRIEVPGLALDPIDETLHEQTRAKSTDYGPALWVASPYNSARSVAAPTAVAIHTTQGSYAGTISWFQSNPYSVSAHYVIRSSDGQLTQMVRESRVANHVKSHNDYTLGIEHEGYVNNAAWYTAAMYNASSALTRHFCAAWSIDCRTAYNGPAGSTINVLSSAVKVKGHQHFSNNTHTDPGINWDWARYYSLLNPATTRVLDTFETDEGHFNTSPAYSGSTTGISSSSTADRICSTARVGSCSERLLLVDNSASSASWAVRFLSGSGSPGANTSLTRANGKVGFWVYVAGSGVSVAIGIDDSDGTERSTAKSIAANTWTFVEWRLDDAAQWDAWVGGNGAISASAVTVDAIWLYRAETSYNVNVYLDEVKHTVGL